MNRQMLCSELTFPYIIQSQKPPADIAEKLVLFHYMLSQAEGDSSNTKFLQ